MQAMSKICTQACIHTTQENILSIDNYVSMTHMNESTQTYLTSLMFIINNMRISRFISNRIQNTIQNGMGLNICGIL